MRGEELQRLSVQQLQELEKTLESGLGSVLKTKVSDDTRGSIRLYSNGNCNLLISSLSKIVEPKNPRRDQRSGKKGKLNSLVKQFELIFISKIRCFSCLGPRLASLQLNELYSKLQSNINILLKDAAEIFYIIFSQIYNSVSSLLTASLVLLNRECN